MTHPPLILLTNDDGVDSPGLRALAAALLDVAELVIVAPKQQQSGAGRGLLGLSEVVHEQPLDLGQVRIIAFALESSPAQAVRFGLMRLTPRRPQLVISGINYGENLGTGITVSGTVGAALEAAASDIPSLAVSLEADREHQLSRSPEVDFSAAAHFAQRFARIMLRDRLPGVDVLKIDIPRGATSTTPWRLTRVSRQRYIHPAADGIDYEIRIDAQNLEPDSDVYAVRVDKMVSVSPLSIDLTASVDFHRLQESIASLGREGS